MAASRKKSPASREAQSLRDRWQTSTTPLATHLHSGTAANPAVISPEIPVTSLHDSRVDLRGYPFSDLRNVALHSVDASYATTHGVASLGYASRFEDCLFDESLLREVNIYAHWQHCRFRNATFQEAHFMIDQMLDCDFSGVHLKRCQVVQGRFERCTFARSRWSRGRVSQVTFVEVAFREAYFERVDVSSCTFIRCDFAGATGQANTASNTFVECACPPAFEERDIDVEALLARVKRPKS